MTDARTAPMHPAPDLSTSGLSIRSAVMELGDGDTRVRALDGVSLDVARGEFVAIVGPPARGSPRCSLSPAP